jgi:predicted O-methyltransferase YrrM
MICYDYINEYIRKTIRGNEGVLAELEEFARVEHVPVIQPEVGRLLAVLASMARPERILEVGTAIGYSAILMAGYLAPEGRIDTIERYELIHVMKGDAYEILRCLDKKYNMIFLDAAKGQYPEFLPECLRMLNKGGILVSDNVLYKGMVATDELVVRRKKTIVKRMREYLDLLCRNEELETSLLPVGDGVAISYKK